MRKVLLILLFIGAIGLTQAQKFSLITNERSVVQDSPESKLSIIKLSSTTENTLASVVILEVWVEWDFYKTQTLNGRNFKRILQRYLVDYRNGELQDSKMIFYNAKGDSIYSQDKSNIMESPIPESVGELIVKQSGLLFETILLLKDPEFYK